MKSGACSGSLRGEGCPPTPRSPGVHSQQNLECTPSLVTSAPHTVYPAKGWVRRALSLCRGVWSPVHRVHPPACTKITLNRVMSEEHVVPNNNLSSLDKFTTTGSETLGKNWDQSGLWLKTIQLLYSNTQAPSNRRTFPKGI